MIGCCDVSEVAAQLGGRQARCRDDDDEDCVDADDESSSGATGDFLLLHNDAGTHRSTVTQPPASTSAALPSDRTTPAGPRGGVASKRSDTDADGDPADAAGDGAPPSPAAAAAAAGANSRLAVHVGLIAGSSVGVVAVLLLAALAVYKYRSRDQGSYRLDPDAPNGYAAAAGSPRLGSERYRLRRTSSSSAAPSDQNCAASGGSAAAIYRLRNSRRGTRSKGRRDVKEWYV